MNADTPTFQTASLYVGDLHPDITESVLYDKFSAAGTILSIRICRDVNTRRSLGYAYVNFQMPAEAERLLDTMNFETIRNMPIRMMWSNRDPTVRRSGIGNIFLKDLHKEIDTKALFDTFSAFGNIISCKVALDDKGKSKGFGFIHFETEEAGNTAIEKVNGKLLNGKKVYVGKFIPRHERVQESGENQPVFTNVYVKNLVEDIDDKKLKTMFERFGNITSCKVMCMDDGKSRGFGFVAFTTTEAAQAAVEALNDQKVNETKNLFVSRAQCKLEREQELKRKFDDFKKQQNEAVQGVNLYVKNLDDTFDDERLRKEFSAYGTITSAIVMTDEQRRSRGFGFVCFSAPNEATRAVTELNGHVIGSKRLFVSLAQRKEDRHALLAAQYSAQQINSGIRMQPQLGQLYQPNGAGGLFVPIMQTGPRFYGGPRAPAPVRNAPRWVAQVRPNAGNQGPAQPGVIYQNANMVAARIQQQPAYNVTPNVMPSDSARTINGQQASASANNMQRPGGSGSATAHNIPQYSPGFDFTATVRNPPVQQQVQAPPQQLPVQLPQQLPVQQKIQESPFATRLLNAKPQEQKQILGERLYPLIQRMHGNLAGKITGMLLEIENSELLHMLVDSDALKAKVQEAIAVLQVKRNKPAN